jgi:hypothetical protein
VAENRITCTKCGTSLSGANIEQILEWDATHRCPPPSLADEVEEGKHDEPHP